LAMDFSMWSTWLALTLLPQPTNCRTSDILPRRLLLPLLSSLRPCSVVEEA
jgi:hypothetical protein